MESNRSAWGRLLRRLGGGEAIPAAIWLLLGLLPLAVWGIGRAAVPVAGALYSPEGEAMLDLSEGFVERMENHSDNDGPLFAGNYAAESTAIPDTLVVVSYNLRYGEAVSETIEALRVVDPLPEAGIILLQEMDEYGVDRLARELGYNYVYFPASVAGDGDNFGNAILARWPISEPRKLILPGLHPITGQQRTATRAVVHAGDLVLLAYSTHIETATAPPAVRAGQFAALLADVPDDATHVILGGDFNTVTAWGVGALAERFAQSALAHDSAGLGPTFTRFGLRPSATDHIFSRGLERLSSGVLRAVTASDHFPVWSRYEWSSLEMDVVDSVDEVPNTSHSQQNAP